MNKDTDQRPTFAAVRAKREAASEDVFSKNAFIEFLKRVGCRVKLAKRIANEEESHFEWLNSIHLFPFRFQTKKLRKGFSLLNIVETPSKWPLWDEYDELAEEERCLRHVAMIFNWPSHGKWVAHNDVDNIEYYSTLGSIIRVRKLKYHTNLVLQKLSSFCAALESEDTKDWIKRLEVEYI